MDFAEAKAFDESGKEICKSGNSLYTHLNKVSKAKEQSN